MISSGLPTVPNGSGTPQGNRRVLLRKFENAFTVDAPVDEVLTSELVSECFGVEVEVTGRRGRWAAAVGHAEEGGAVVV